jgi:cytochrome c-type biogenesis protein
VPKLKREWRPEELMRRAHTGGPIIAGLAFAVAWLPCTGPTLGVILTAASNQSTVGKGAVLLAVYSLGLAVPFLLCALAMASMTRFFKFFRDHFRVLTFAAGLILVVMGVMLYTNDLTRLNTWANDLGLNLISGV